jgi:hypothetical protein
MMGGFYEARHDEGTRFHKDWFRHTYIHTYIHREHGECISLLQKSRLIIIIHGERVYVYRPYYCVAMKGNAGLCR